MKTKTPLWIVLTAALAIALLTLGAGAAERPSAVEPIAAENETVADAVAGCGVAAAELFSQPFEALMGGPGGPGECALDFDCAMGCQATQHACSMACPGYPYDIPWWQACLQQCRDAEEICALGCCL